ncbi:MAG: leucine-rich repeat domain-containing protein [Bacilli bacterium]|nr:leucine-rich repeat domain-containing protein [Bacilli bacterium]
MENKNLFYSFKYVVGNNFIYDDKVVVKVFYLHEYKNIIKNVDVKKKDGADESYYVNEAKKIISRMLKDGSLEKYSNGYIKKEKRKKILALALPLLCIGVVGAAVGTYFALTPSAPEVKVIVPEINGLVVDNQKAYVGVDYNTGISVNKTLTDCVLPDELTKVTSGNRTITNKEYTYDVADNKETATLFIPGKYIEDIITITLSLVEPTPSVDPYKVTVAEFNDACSFTGVQYVQASLSNSTESITLLQQLSPTVYHSVNEGSSFYIENFVKKEDGTYEKAARNDKEGNYSFEEATESDFITPQSDQFSVMYKLNHAGLSYASFTYNDKEGVYTAIDEGTGERAKTTITLKFENKKLVSKKDVIEGGNAITETTVYKYETITPAYPERPIPPVVDEAFEFDFAGIGCTSSNTTYEVEPGQYEFTITALNDFDALNDAPSEITVGGVSIIDDNSKYTYTKTGDKQATLLINDVTGDVYVEMHAKTDTPSEAIELTYVVPSATYGIETEQQIKYEVPSQSGEDVYVSYDNGELLPVTDGFIEHDFSNEATGSEHKIHIYGNIDTIRANDLDEWGYYDEPLAVGNYAITSCTLYQDLGKPHEEADICVDYSTRAKPPVSLRNNLSVVKVGDNVSTIPNSIFYRITNPKSIEIGKNVKRINKHAFDISLNGESTSDCYFHLPESVDYIEESGIFAYTDSYESNNHAVLYTGLDDYPEHWHDRSIYMQFNHILFDCPNAPTKHTSADNNYDYYLTSKNEASAIAYRGEYTSDAFSIPENIDGYPVTSINSYFMSLSNEPVWGSTLHVTIPSTVKYIWHAAFSYTSEINSLIFAGAPNNSALQHIAIEAFFGASLNNDLVIPNSVKRIDNGVFHNACCDTEGEKRALSLTLSENLEYIGECAFANTNFTSLNFSKHTTYIGGGVISGEYLTSIEVDDENPRYSDCDMNVIYEPKTKTVLCGTSDFNLPADAKKIGDNSFNSTKFSKEVVIPNTIEIIGDSAFDSAYMPLGLSFEENSKLTTIEDGAFSGYNSGITGEVILPEGLTYIGSDAFSWNTSITHIYIPDSMKDGYMGSWVFTDWTSNQTISYPTPTPGCWDEGWYNQCSANLQERASI